MLFGINFAGIAARFVGSAMLKRVGGNAAGDAKALFAWIGRRTPLELIGFVFAALFVWQHFGLVHTRHALAACTAARKDDAAALSASHANEKLLRGQLTDQNNRVKALATKSADEQQQAHDALQRGAQRVADARGIAQALAASSRHSPPPAPAGKAPVPNCEPSDLVKEQWK